MLANQSVSPHERRCIEKMNRMIPLATIEKLTDSLEVSASELLKYI
jgi:DNA-binding Xre family transcriptional regulator